MNARHTWVYTVGIRVLHKQNISAIKVSLCEALGWFHNARRVVNPCSNNFALGRWSDDVIFNVTGRTVDIDSEQVWAVQRCHETSDHLDNKVTWWQYKISVAEINCRVQQSTKSSADSSVIDEPPGGETWFGGREDCRSLAGLWCERCQWRLRNEISSVSCFAGRPRTQTNPSNTSTIRRQRVVVVPPRYIIKCLQSWPAT